MKMRTAIFFGSFLFSQGMASALEYKPIRAFDIPARDVFPAESGESVQTQITAQDFYSEISGFLNFTEIGRGQRANIGCFLEMKKTMEGFLLTFRELNEGVDDVNPVMVGINRVEGQISLKFDEKMIKEVVTGSGFARRVIRHEPLEIREDPSSKMHLHYYGPFRSKFSQQSIYLGVTILEEQNQSGDFVTSGINFQFDSVGCTLVPAM